MTLTPEEREILTRAEAILHAHDVCEVYLHTGSPNTVSVRHRFGDIIMVGTTTFILADAVDRTDLQQARLLAEIERRGRQK